MNIYDRIIALYHPSFQSLLLDPPSVSANAPATSSSPRCPDKQMTSTAEASFEIQCQWFCCSNLTKNPQKRPKSRLNWQQLANIIWWLELKRWNHWKSLPGLPTCCCKPGQGWTSSRPSPTLHPSCAGVVAFYQRLGPLKPHPKNMNG